MDCLHEFTLYIYIYIYIYMKKFKNSISFFFFMLFHHLPCNVLTAWFEEAIELLKSFLIFFSFCL